MDYWRAYYRVEPYGQSWHQTSRLASLIWTLNANQLAAAGVKSTVLTENDFLPVRQPVQKRDTESVFDANAAKVFGSLMAAAGLEESRRMMEEAKPWKWSGKNDNDRKSEL